MNAPLIAGCTVASLGCATLHWMPLSETYKKPSVPRRIIGYTSGVLAILAGLWIATDRTTAAKAFAVSASAGAATVGAYIVDEYLHGRIA